MIAMASTNLGSTPTFPTSNHSKRAFRYPSPFVLSKLSRVSDFQAGKRRCECFDLYKELVPYGEAWSWQKSIVKERRALIEQNEDFSDTLIILQHHPVYTLGTASSEEYLNFNIKNAPYDVYRTERGGEVTYHGPGQLVMYPIVNLRYHKMDLHWYLRALEDIVIRVLSSTFSIKASRLEGLTGVWVGDRKLAAIGIRVSQWVAYHGLALNVTTDLTPFQQIVPCGIRDRGLEQRLNEVEQFYSTPSKKNLNTSKSSSIVKDKDKKKHVASFKKHQNNAFKREAAAAKRMQELMRQFGTILRQYAMKAYHLEALRFRRSLSTNGWGPLWNLWMLCVLVCMTTRLLRSPWTLVQ
ncbi:hypothetical protein F0562_000531 [Nyssa sinensis]|uniref:lipoyl(octanoyl) transferase n=1 Tax=Nyssa sinensis TaxID=561372 RepID=A0A5J5C4K4_9ASTE|nr:hypothetical protein F0562_000531 [Nyssa sinensis]